jgi:hypothetical protein
MAYGFQPWETTHAFLKVRLPSGTQYNKVCEYGKLANRRLAYLIACLLWE